MAGLIAVWALTLIAATLRMAWMNVPELVAGGTFVGLGWAAGLALPGVWLHSGDAAETGMFTAASLYAAGALSYHRRWPNPSPAIFGYHEVFHVFVCAAAALFVHGDSAVHRLKLPRSSAMRSLQPGAQARHSYARTFPPLIYPERTRPSLC